MVIARAGTQRFLCPAAPNVFSDAVLEERNDFCLQRWQTVLSTPAFLSLNPKRPGMSTRSPQSRHRSEKTDMALRALIPVYLIPSWILRVGGLAGFQQLRCRLCRVIKLEFWYVCVPPFLILPARLPVRQRLASMWTGIASFGSAKPLRSNWMHLMKTRPGAVSSASVIVFWPIR